MDVPGGTGASSRHKRSSSSKRKERRDSTKEAEPSARVRSHSVADLPPAVMSQLAWAEGDSAGPEKSRGSIRAKHESGKEREKRASRSRRDRGDELDKQNSCSESSSSSTGGGPPEESKKGREEKKGSKKSEGRAEKPGSSKKTKRASRSPRSRKDTAGKAKRDSKRHGRSTTVSEDGSRPGPPPSTPDAVVIRSSVSPRRLSDPEVSPRKPERATQKRHQRRSSDSSDGERVAERNIRAERKEKARAEREPKRMRVRRMASYNDSLKSGSSDDEDEPEQKASPFLGRKTRKGARKHSRSMSSENLLQDAWDGAEQPREGMDPLLHKRISDQARERRKNSRAAQLNHSDIAVALSSSLAKVKEDRAPNRRLRAGTSLSRIHKHKPHQPDAEASEAFTQALVSSDSDLLVAVCRSEADLAYGGSPELLRHILDLLACEGQLEDFVACFLRQELEETASSSLVFRGVSIASVLFAGHFFYEAGAYVRETVLPLVTHVCSFGRSWEVNPAAADEDTDVKENTTRISTLFEGFLDKIFGKNHHLPA